MDVLSIQSRAVSTAVPSAVPSNVTTLAVAAAAYPTVPVAAPSSAVTASDETIDAPPNETINAPPPAIAPASTERRRLSTAGENARQSRMSEAKARQQLKKQKALADRRAATTAASGVAALPQDVQMDEINRRKRESW